MNYQKLSDNELIPLLFTEEDRLPRAAVEEFIRRGEKVFWPLADIVSNQYSWTREPPEWWAVVHAVYIIGAIGEGRGFLPLSRALRWAVAYDCDWVVTELPSIFGRLGIKGSGVLKFISKDITSDWYTRAIAMEGLAAITINNPETEEEAFSFIGSIFKDEYEEWDVKQSAGNILLDFLRGEYKDDLLAFGREEQRLKDEDALFSAAFFDSDVEDAFLKGKKDLWSYTRDWLSFYDENEIRKRQERWKKEDEEERRLLAAEEALLMPKIGRNDPCPCGSGKKYKKCCLGKETLH